ncbi:hypothetical protein P8452_69374 [Trifolium repens]|nr:hypothetical protein P8452_69374 [Trifolium repens]
MAVKVTKWTRTDRNRTDGIIPTTCYYWLNGRCNRNPCRFLHSEPPLPSTASCSVSKTVNCNGRKRCSLSESENSLPKRKIKVAVWNRKSGDSIGKTEVVEAAQSSSPNLCKYWIDGNCVHGDKCRDIHSWLSGDRLSAVINFEGHKKLVTGITLPVGTNKLFSGSTDGTVRIWDCYSGQCANVINLGAEVNSLISEGTWIFVGLSNIVKAWNIQTGSQYTLDGPNGRVLAMIVGNDTLLAGAEDGVISAWRGIPEANSPFKLVASLRGHAKYVVCLTVGCLNKRLFSGSMDHSIKVWDLDTFECKMTVNGHTDTVTSLICWDNFLLSSSWDCTIKVWAANEENTNLEVAYSHNVENGIVALNGMTDAEDNHILLCSCRDNSVRLYELPSFSERGRLFARREVRSIEKGPGGLIFTGDGTGLVTVSKWSEQPKLEAASASA